MENQLPPDVEALYVCCVPAERLIGIRPSTWDAGTIPLPTTLAKDREPGNGEMAEPVTVVATATVFVSTTV